MIDRIGQQLGNYRLIRPLGRGGYAEVYLGEHLYLKRQAAIKILHTLLKDEQKANFLIEAQRLVDLAHPSIIQVFDFAIEGGLPYLIMEYAPNGTLRTRHPKGSCLPLATVVSYVQYIAAPLQYLHDQKLVHRDVKPENLLVGKNQEILLGDFGIAAIAHQTNSLNMQGLAGTPAYMAPEQSQGMSRAASDQYALGTVAYEWLCGTTPFQGSVMALGVQHLSTPPPSLRQHISAIPPAVEDVILKALAKKPQQRFPTITEFAEALEEASQPTQTVPVISPPQQSQNPPPPSSPPTENKNISRPIAVRNTSSAFQNRNPDSPPTQKASASRERKGLSDLIKVIPLIVLALGIAIGGFVIYDFSHAKAPPTHGVSTASPHQTPTVQPTQQNVLAIDTFQRPNQALWGTASDGQSWSVDTTAQPYFSINNSMGIITGGHGPLEALMGPPTDNVNVTMIASINQFITVNQCMNSVNLGIVLRWTDPKNWYKACIDGKQLVILKCVHGHQSPIGTPKPVSLSTGSWQRLRFASFGIRLSAKVWSSNENEPPDWQTFADDPTFTTGRFGIRVVEQSTTVIRIASFNALKGNKERDT